MIDGSGGATIAVLGTTFAIRNGVAATLVIAAGLFGALAFSAKSSIRSQVTK